MKYIKETCALCGEVVQEYEEPSLAVHPKCLKKLESKNG